MFKKCIIIFILICPVLAVAQIKNINYKTMLDSLYSHTVPLITIDSFKRLKNVYVLDTRESKEYEVSHLKNALNVSYIWFDMRTIYKIPKDATVIVYCTVGYRSEKIGEKLLKSGYRHIYNLHGGIFEWANQCNPVYKTNGTQTSEIHTYESEWAKWLSKGTKVN